MHASILSIDVLRTLTSVLGAGLALHLSYNIFAATWLYTRRSNLQRYLYTDDAGREPWALVTGSSDGIGKCLAAELARRGFNVVLHGRNPSKLEGVRKELQAVTPGIKFRILVADASQCHSVSAVDFEDIRRQVAELHLTVLVNCAGAGPNPSFGALDTFSRDQIIGVLQLNAVFPTMMTATLLPLLKGAAPKQNGHIITDKDESGRIPKTIPSLPSRAVTHGGRHPALIINIGSVTDAGFPLVSFYSAGKSAAHALHQAVAREVSLVDPEVDIEIISHRVGAVTGVSHQQAPPTLFRPDARTLAHAILARTGCGRKSVVPYWPHALQQACLAVTPGWVMDRVLGDALREELRMQEEELKRT